jgi:type I restriction enzyme, S subunit
MAVEELIGSVPEGWEYTTLGAACEHGGGSIQTGPFGSQLHASDYVRVGVPSIMPQNIGDNRIVEEGIARITAEDAQRLSRYLVRPGDIVYSRRGDVERRALVRDHEDGWLCGTGCLRVRLGESGPDPLYTSYYLGHPDVREWIVRHAHGATMPNLNTSILAACPFLYPPINEQRAIAHILGTLDEKIELNRRMSATLEAMARALFKSWFVDFDPVRAKVEGRESGLPEHLAALFPDRLVESELGEVPEGWAVEDASWCSEVVYGAPFKSALFNEEGTGQPLIRIRDLRTHDPSVSTPEMHPRGYLVQPGDLVVGMDGEFRAHLWRGPAAWLNQRVCCFKSRPAVPRAFVHYSIESLLEFFERSKTGTTVIHLGKADIDTFRVLKPVPDVLEAFGKLIDPADRRIVSTAVESRTVADLRDTLLPKLISGQLRVGDAGRILEKRT